MELFRNIAILPPRDSYLDGLLADGGPDWPDFDRQMAPRHIRSGGRAVDRRPSPWDGTWQELTTPAVWGGFLHHAFGHLVAELTTRLPWSLHERPDDTYLFVTGAGTDVGGLRPHIPALLHWYGLRPDQWQLVQTGLRAAELRVAPQAEHLFGPPPAPEHLAALDQIAARNGLAPDVTPVLYVHRLGMIPRGSGGHAGERYLVERLAAQGVPVLDPAQAPLARQLAAYAGARTVIFAEGSAVHGRQLLGWRDQQIVILNRRPGEKLARAALGARVPRLEYAEATAQIVAGVRTDGAIRFQKGLSVYDLDTVFAAFRAQGVDLARDWDMAAYRASVLADLRDWAAMMATWRASTDMAATRARLEQALAAAGLSAHAAAVVERIAHAA